MESRIKDKNGRLHRISLGSNVCGCATYTGIDRTVMDEGKKSIKSFHDMDVYQSTKFSHRKEQRNQAPSDETSGVTE